MAGDFDVLLPGRTLDQVRSAALSNGAHRLSNGLQVRVTGDRIRAIYRTGGRYDLPPVLRGHLVESADGTTIAGRLRWRSAGVFAATLWIAALLLVGFAVAAGLGGGVPAGIVAILAVGGIALVLIGVRLAVTGRRTRQADRTLLAAALTRALAGEPAP